MSRLYASHRDGQWAVLGAERHWLGTLSDEVGMSLLDGHYLSELATWMEVDAYGMTPPGTVYTAQVVDHVRLAFRYSDMGGSGPVLTHRGHEVDTWTLSLNTCMRLGSDPVRLAARLHAQGEIHCWVEAEHTSWLAGLITSGRRSGVLRRGMGWEELATGLLKHSTDSPVVFSSSVADSFPSPHLSTWEPPEGCEDTWAAWAEALTEDQQWDASMEALRAEPGQLELTPEGWEEYTFGNGVSWLDLQWGEDNLLEILAERDREEVKA